MRVNGPNGAHELCPACLRIAEPYLGLYRDRTGNVTCAFVGSVHLKSSHKVGRGTRARWLSASPLSWTTIPCTSPYGPSTTWHVEVTNLYAPRGSQKLMLCAMTDHARVTGSLTFREWDEQRSSAHPPAASLDAPPSWDRFLQGHWSREVPVRPGVYPVRPVSSPNRPAKYFPVVRVDVYCPRRDDVRVTYQYPDGTEMRPEMARALLTFWSEPIPPMPADPVPDEVER